MNSYATQRNGMPVSGLQFPEGRRAGADTERPGALTCPACGWDDAIVPIVYGHLTAELAAEARAGLLVAGGQGFYDDDRDPTHFCTRCQTSFGLPE